MSRKHKCVVINIKKGRSLFKGTANVYEFELFGTL